MKSLDLEEGHGFKSGAWEVILVQPLLRVYGWTPYIDHGFSFDDD
jgi:hypothetical protein